MKYYLGYQLDDEMTGHAACKGEMGNACKVLVERSGRKRPLERPRHRWDDNIKINSK
jgi:hypothetical protein